MLRKDDIRNGWRKSGKKSAKFEIKNQGLADQAKSIFKKDPLPVFEVLQVCIYQPLYTGRMRHKVNFFVDFNRFYLKVFFLLDCLATKAREPSVPNYLQMLEGELLN